MSLGCYGLYGSEAECCWCTDRVSCKAETKKRLERWRKYVEMPKKEETWLERERRLNGDGLRRWAEREKVKERIGK